MMWELVGAVVGAGFASGREIAAFFAKYGALGFAGIAAAGVVLCMLGTIQHPIQWRFHWMEKAWRFLLAAMLVTTAGAMLAGAGELAGLILPIRGARLVGLAGTYVLAWMLANRSISGFAWVSKVLLIVLCGIIFAALLRRTDTACLIVTEKETGWLLSGMMYGGFNAALQVPILEGRHESAIRKRCVVKASMIFCFLVVLGTALLLKAPELIYEPMPFLKAVGSWGKTGYVVFALCLYLSILSTLTACFKGVKSMFEMLAVIALSQFGFTGVVDQLYPLLGTGCFLMLVCAKFAKTGSSPFHSR